MAPTFTSAPVTAAAEGTAYTYQLSANGAPGDSIAFSLTTSPAGAVLNGNTITWTPTPEQSRTANQFSVVAITTRGASATQSWSVTPAGTVRITWVDTLWDQNGATQRPHDWTFAPAGLPFVGALVPQPDGPMKQFSGTGDANGTFTIPNVPGGYYWLWLGPRSIYWTSSSTFDFGTDFAGSTAVSTIPFGGPPTIFHFNFSGLEPTATASYVDLTAGLFNFETPALPGSATASLNTSLSTNADFSQVKRAHALQYMPASFGTIAGSVLGSAATLTDPGWATGVTNSADIALQPSPKRTFSFTINGSAWNPLFSKVGPSAATPGGTPFHYSVQPNVVGATQDTVSATSFISRSGEIDLFSPALTSTSVFSGILLSTRRMGPCAAGRLTVPPPSLEPPTILTDQDLGSIEFGDPFPAEWTRTFSLCQQQYVPAPTTFDPSAVFRVTNGLVTATPNSTVLPLIGPVQNPKINGQDLFTPATVSGPLTLTWSPPGTGTPTGYQVEVFVPIVQQIGATTYTSSMVLSTTKTTMTLLSAVPPGTVEPIFIVITALADAKADIETRPRRHGVPSANADIVSAAITIAPPGN